MEAYAGRMAMEIKARKEVTRGAKTDLFKIMEEHGRDRLTSGIWERALKQGDDLATRLIDRAVKALGAGVASCVNVIDPEAVIIGGGLGSRFGERYVRRIAARMHPHLFVDDRPPAIRLPALGDLGGGIGAALLVDARVRHRSRHPLDRRRDGAGRRNRDREHATRRNGGSSGCSDVLSIAAGVLALAYPDITLLVLGLIVGINLVLIGCGLGGSRRPSEQHTEGGRVLRFIVGFLAILAGLVCLVRPGAGVLALLIALSFWFILTGVADLARALDRAREQRVIAVILGVIGIAAGVIIVANPDIGLTTLALLAGIGFIVRGTVEVMAGLYMRRLATSVTGGSYPRSAGSPRGARLSRRAGLPRTLGSGLRDPT